MKRTIMAVLVGKRKETAVTVQKILTGWGCLIKTRLGIHDGIQKDCTNRGLIIMELTGTPTQIRTLKHKLSLVPDISVKVIELSLKK